MTKFEVQTLVDSKAEAETEAVAGKTRHGVCCFCPICMIPSVSSRAAFSLGVSLTRVREVARESQVGRERMRCHHNIV